MRLEIQSHAFKWIISVWCEVIKNPLKWIERGRNAHSAAAAAAASRLSLLHFCPCLQRPLLQNKNCINELFSLRKTLSGKAEYKEYLLIPCYVIFSSPLDFIKRSGPSWATNSWQWKEHFDCFIPAELEGVGVVARGRHGAQSSRFDCQMGRMAGLEWAWGPALWILFIALPSNAKRNSECSSCIFNMQLVSQMFLQTCSAS